MTRPSTGDGVDLGADGDTFTIPLRVPRALLTIVAAPPDTLSQRNVFDVTGIPPRAYLKALREPGFGVPVARIGKLRVVDRAVFVAWLRAQATAPRGTTAAGGVGAGDGVDAVLAEVGYRRVGAASR